MVELYFRITSRGAVISLKTSKSGVNLVKGYIRLIGKNKKISHLLRRIIYEGPLPPIYTREKVVLKLIKIKDSEFKDLLKILEEGVD